MVEARDCREMDVAMSDVLRLEAPSRDAGAGRSKPSSLRGSMLKVLLVEDMDDDGHISVPAGPDVDERLDASGEQVEGMAKSRLKGLPDMR